MTEDNPYQAHAEDCLQKARAADKEADKWSWLMLAESFFRLSDFRKHVKHALGDTERQSLGICAERSCEWSSRFVYGQISRFILRVHGPRA